MKDNNNNFFFFLKKFSFFSYRIIFKKVKPLAVELQPRVVLWHAENQLGRASTRKLRREVTPCSFGQRGRLRGPRCGGVALAIRGAL